VNAGCASQILGDGGDRYLHYAVSEEDKPSKGFVPRGTILGARCPTKIICLLPSIAPANVAQ